MLDKIERLLKNYSNANYSREAWKFMFSSGDFNIHTGIYDYETSKRKQVDENPLLTHLRFLAYKDFHIEIYKIIKKSKRNKDNIFNILEEFVVIRPDLKKDIENTLAELENIKEDIDRITNIRDKFYAHLDPDHLDYGGQGTLNHHEKVLFIISKAVTIITSEKEHQALLDKVPYFTI
jgi:hypothetical protein